MTTQLLFGEIFTILQTSEDQKWLEIHIYHDNYVGWIDILQCTFVSEKYFKDYTRKRSKLKVLIDVLGSVRDKSADKSSINSFPMYIFKGSVLPFVKKEAYFDAEICINEKDYLVSGPDYHSINTELLKKKYQKEIVKNALIYLNAPYLWGGRTIFGIDCSGLIQQVFRSVGYYLPRDAYQQAEEGKLVDFDAKKQGDLAFFIRENKIIHVGIVLEDNKIIHARGQVRIDTLTETGILDENTNEYSHYLAFLKRIL